MHIARDVWVLVFAASLLLTIIGAAVQRARGRAFSDTRLLPVIFVLHVSWAIPLIVYLILATAKIWIPMLIIAWGGFMLLVGAAAGTAALMGFIKRKRKIQ
jgi:hypothetical protein